MIFTMMYLFTVSILSKSVSYKKMEQSQTIQRLYSRKTSIIKKSALVNTVDGACYVYLLNTSRQKQLIASSVDRRCRISMYVFGVKKGLITNQLSMKPFWELQSPWTVEWLQIMFTYCLISFHPSFVLFNLTTCASQLGLP